MSWTTSTIPGRPAATTCSDLSATHLCCRLAVEHSKAQRSASHLLNASPNFTTAACTNALQSVFPKAGCTCFHSQANSLG
eukprot:6186637-Pleurochrysis_carterae.AAC.2